MDEYLGVTDRDSTKLQERHYYLLSELQTLVKDLPSSFQQRLTYNTLSDLALALIDGTVYEIVQGLLDIQHLTEKNLYNQRQKLHCEHQGLKQDLVRKHKDALQSCKPHNLSLLKTTQQTELEALEVRVREEQKMMDKKIVVEMDQKVTDQQNTLEKAGVPGFYITTNPLAGASSVWASCCGLLNEVMGTGAVRGQQPGFGAGAGPFRFAPSAGYSTYPPNSSGNPGLVCKACGQAFSVFRRKYTCCDCKKSFCSLCTVVLESLRICSTCHLLKATEFHRPRLMRLRVRDLRQYLLLRNISTDTCREKEDLVDLVLCHQAFEVEDEEEEEEDDDDDDEEEVEDPNTASLLSHIHRTLTDSITPPASELSAATLEESLSRSESPETNQDSDETTPVSLLNLDSSEQTPQTSPQTRHGAGASVSDISGVRDITGLSVRQLKEILARNFVNYSGCCEKWELVERVNRLYREKEKNTNTYGEKCPLTLQDDNLCRICMDAVIDCVLLECGHLVTCTDCGKRMNQCPICRQYVVRAVHVFKC